MKRVAPKLVFDCIAMQHACGEVALATIEKRTTHRKYTQHTAHTHTQSAWVC